MKKNSRIFVAGHRGLVGSAIWKSLENKGYSHLIGRTHKELDLEDPAAVREFFDREKPEYVFLAAAFVGGIIANSRYRADFIFRNLQIQQNVIGESFRHGVSKLLFLGSTCIYPREAPQPMKETALLTSPLEYTNEPYAIAKIAGLKMCESFNLQYGTNYIAVMPTNLYGPNDNFHLENSHVLPAMVRKIHLAKCLMEGDWNAVRKDLNARPVEQVDGTAEEKEILAVLAKYGITPGSVELWGTGTPLREFLWSEDMADACVHVMEQVDFSQLQEGGREVRNCHINIGTGKEISIGGLARLIAATAGYRGNLAFNADKPDGTMRKLTDVSKLHSLGWKHRVELEEGVERIYRWYLSRPGGRWRSSPHSNDQPPGQPGYAPRQSQPVGTEPPAGFLPALPGHLHSRTGFLRRAGHGSLYGGSCLGRFHHPRKKHGGTGGSVFLRSSQPEHPDDGLDFRAGRSLRPVCQGYGSH